MSELAIHGGSKVKTKKFPRWPVSNFRESELLNEVLTSGNWWRMTGDKVESFERLFAAEQETTYCLGVTNGTHALELALTAAGVGRGDEVIVPAVTFISTATAVIYCNATPVLVDVDPETYCMSVKAFEKAITPRTKAVIPVHMAGHACDMYAICNIAHDHNLLVIEDAAHGHGGKCGEHKLGSMGDLGIFSFQNGKIMTCGEGGALVTSHKQLYERAFLIHGVGRPKNDTVYEHKLLGSNDRMNEFQAAVLIAQLERLDSMNRIRDINALLLDALLQDIPGIRPQARAGYATVITHYMYMFEYNPKEFGGLSRDNFIAYLNAEGIPAFPCFPVISKTAFFESGDFNKRIEAYHYAGEAELTNATHIAGHVVWLPHYTLLGDAEDIHEIAQAISKIHKAVHAGGHK